MNSLKPKYRSKIRLFCGKKYYCMKRYMLWMFGDINFAKDKRNEMLEYTCFGHKTPLLRTLKDVDMELQYNKIQNLKIAVSHINNIIINPGETFSYWKLIGKPTKRKGYKKGMVLHCGSFKEGTGGGLCQLSNLIYWMTLHTPLTITERYRHSYDVFPDSNRKLPFGSGATCVYNYRDLMIKNEINQPFQLNVWLTKDNLCGSIRTSLQPLETYEVYEKEHKFQQEMFGKYSRHNILYRKIFNLEGIQVGEEYVTENHALMMYEPLIEAKCM